MVKFRIQMCVLTVVKIHIIRRKENFLHEKMSGLICMNGKRRGRLSWKNKALYECCQKHICDKKLFHFSYIGMASQ